jgi:hypothetical protein
MESRRRIAFGVAVGFLAMAASPAWAQKNSAAATFSAPFTGDDTITASITKGKKKRLLIANATAVIEDEVLFDTSCDLLLRLTANGVRMLTGAGAEHAEVTCDCPSGNCAGCTANATAYLDLDGAEEVNPGLFVKQPIDVQLEIVANGSGACTGGVDDAATLVVQMVKK